MRRNLLEVKKNSVLDLQKIKRLPIDKAIFNDF